MKIFVYNQCDRELIHSFSPLTDVSAQCALSVIQCTGINKLIHWNNFILLIDFFVSLKRGR